jgi:hypothetical protein
MITLATIEACSMIFLRQSLEIAAYEGARAAIVPGTDQDDVQQKCLVLAAARGVNGTSASVTPSNFQNAAYGTFIKVTVTAPCDANGLLAPLFYANQTITAEVEMMNEY